jgi:hypothetical protein
MMSIYHKKQTGILGLLWGYLYFLYVDDVREKRNVYRLLVGKPEGKRPLGRPRRRWMDNIKMDRLEIGVNVVDRIGLA